MNTIEINFQTVNTIEINFQFELGQVVRLKDPTGEHGGMQFGRVVERMFNQHEQGTVISYGIRRHIGTATIVGETEIEDYTPR